MGVINMRPIISGAMKLSLTNSVILQDRPHIGYKNIVDADNITATSTAAGFYVESLANGTTTERWKPNAIPASLIIDAGEQVDVQYIGIGAHTIGNYANTVTVYYSNDGATYTKIADILPITNRAIMFCFDTITARFFKIRLTGGTGLPAIGVVQIGELLTMQHKMYGGHSPITLSRNSNTVRNMTEGGQFAGVSFISGGVSTGFSFDNLTAQWYRDNFDPFVLHARTKPFFITWYNAKFAREAAFVWTSGDIKPSNTGTVDFMSVELNVIGVGDD